MVDTKGIEPAKVLKALYDNARVQGMGIIQFIPGPMSIEHARELMAGTSKYFDYCYGRVMKVDLINPDGFNEFLYDRDNGNGAAQRAIDSLKEADAE